MEQIERAMLPSGQQGERMIHVLHGLLGIGITQLAIAYLMPRNTKKVWTTEAIKTNSIMVLNSYTVGSLVSRGGRRRQIPASFGKVRIFASLRERENQSTLTNPEINTLLQIYSTSNNVSVIIHSKAGAHLSFQEAHPQPEHTYLQS